MQNAGKIKVMPPELVSKIAAGEVVERPASIIKELVENSIDAEADSIIIRIENAGLQLIEVSDNGSGMTKADAVLALHQHASSKLTSIEELEKIGTLGFRGEALASIASVSDLSIHTTTGSENPVLVSGYESNIQEKLGPGREQGTTINVRNIFHNVPARRKFLRSEATEYRHILDIVYRLACVHFKVGFKFIKDGKQVLHLNKDNSFTERINQLYPKYNILPVSYDSPELKITGGIAHPSQVSNDSSLMHIYINRRPIEDRLLYKASKEGFNSTLMKGKFPVLFINIEIDSQKVDVNVHPRKLEVRFSEPQKIFLALKIAIEKALAKSFQGSLSENFEHANTFSAPSSPLKTTTKNAASVSASIDFTENILAANTYEAPHISANIFSEATSSVSDITNGFNKMHQYFNTYIVFEEKDKLLFIDQHAADERIKYEKIKNKLDKEMSLERQPLLIPDTLNITPKEKQLLFEYENEINILGFSISAKGTNEVELLEIPAILGEKDYLETFSKLLNKLESAGKNTKSAFLDSIDDFIATLACHGSIRAGRRLAESEISKLISDLFNCQLPYSCPHGRPIIWELTRNELEKNFKRKL